MSCLTATILVCQTNEACRPLVPAGDGTTIRPSSLYPGDLQEEDDSDVAVCYKEGFAVKKMHQMCDVTSQLQNLV